MNDIANEIIKKIALRLDIPYEKVYHVCKFQFDKVVEVIKEGEEDIKLPKLGKFVNKKKRNGSTR